MRHQLTISIKIRRHDIPWGRATRVGSWAAKCAVSIVFDPQIEFPKTVQNIAQANSSIEAGRPRMGES